MKMNHKNSIVQADLIHEIEKNQSTAERFFLKHYNKSFIQITKHNHLVYKIVISIPTNSYFNKKARI